MKCVKTWIMAQFKVYFVYSETNVDYIVIEKWGKQEQIKHK